MPAYRGPVAAVFDLDGVITLTARVHAAAWKELFDAYLRERATQGGPPFRAFDLEQDYRSYVDGKSRYDGVRSFLASRGIHLEEGSPSDGPEKVTVCGLGNRKDALFVEKVRQMGVDVDDAAVRFVRELRACAMPVGLASSSRNAVPILERVGLLSLFDAVVDGVAVEKLGLKGKPNPDIFLTCLRQLPGRNDPQRSIVVEDAIAGVEAGRRGGFGAVIGVDRHQAAAELREHGANLVIDDFRQINVARLVEFFRSRERVA